VSIRDTLFKFDRVVQRGIAPGLKYSQSPYEDVLKSRVHEQISLLDMGYYNIGKRACLTNALNK